MQMLIDKGASLDAKDVFGKTALVKLATLKIINIEEISKYLEVLQILIKGAEVNELNGLGCILCHRRK